MIHAYVWAGNPLGLFAMWNPRMPPVIPFDGTRETGTHDPVKESQVALSIERFSYRDAEIKVGETLVWTNVDGSPHTITSGSRGEAEPGFASGFVGAGQSFALPFNEAGWHSYACSLHPIIKTKVVVTD